MQHRKLTKEDIINKRTRPKVKLPQEARQKIPTAPIVTGPKFLCCYPSAPLLKKYDDSGNYTMAGELACRSDLFMRVDTIGFLTTSPPYSFTRAGNIYQCALCGVMYRIMPDNTILMLMREKWLKVEPSKGIIYLADGTIKTVLFDVNDMSKEEEYIDKEKSVSESYSEFNI